MRIDLPVVGMGLGLLGMGLATLGVDLCCSYAPGGIKHFETRSDIETG